MKDLLVSSVSRNSSLRNHTVIIKQNETPKTSLYTSGGFTGGSGNSVESPFESKSFHFPGKF